MKRRSFLVGSAAAALTTWPAWLARAFDPDSACKDGEDERVQGLFDGYRAARRAGKPLLVLIIPQRDEDKWERGQQFGQVLNYADDPTLAMLGLVTLGCATKQELARLVQLDADADEPTFVTVDTAIRPALARAYRVEPAAAVPDRWEWQGKPEDYEGAEDRAIDAQIAAFSSALKTAIAAATAGSKPGPTRYESEQLARAILSGGGEVDNAAVLRAASTLYQRAQASAAADRAKLIAGLAAAVRAEVVSRPVRGSQWASSGGCGVTIEGLADDEQHMVACGMGHVPARSARFLYFFTRTTEEG